MSRSVRWFLPRPVAAAGAVLLAAAMLPLLALPAEAIGGFESADGNMVADGGTDWANAAGVVRADDVDCPGGDDTIFGTGSQKNDDTEYNLGCGSVPPNKNDLRRAYGTTQEQGDTIYLYLAYALESKTGSAHVDFELNQSELLQNNGVLKQRSVGDILITYDWNGSSEIRIARLVWDGTEWANEQVLNGGTADAGVNAPPTQNPGTTTTDPIAGDSYVAETFGEVGIDATAAGFFPPGQCRTFGSATVKTRSSGESFNSELKDYIAPIDIAFSNCSSIRILKTDDSGNPLAGAAFSVTGNGVNETCTTDASGYCSVSDLFPDPDPYVVTETQAPDGYLSAAGPQNVTISERDTVYNVTFENDLGDVRWEKRDATNGALIGGATFVVTATGGDAQSLGWGPLTVVDNGANDEDATPGEFAVSDLYTGTYSVEETVAPTGYELSTPNPKTFTISDATPSPDLTGTTTNTSTTGSFQNPRKLTDLTVKKWNDDKSLELAGASYALYRESNNIAGLQRPGDTAVGDCTTGADGTCSAFDLTWGQYYWVEIEPPPGYNFSNTTVQGPITINANNAGTTLTVTEFTNPQTELVTDATDANLPGAEISDTATLSGVPDNAGGTITFRLYSDDTCSTLVYTSPAVAVSGPGSYGGPSVFTHPVTQAGSYYWIAEYSGDPTNQVNGATGACGDAGETSVVRPATPGIQTQVSDDSVRLPNVSVTDKATLSPVTQDATGTVDFSVYDNDQCTGTPVFTSLARPITVLQGQSGYYAEATSGTFSPINAGTYYWIAEYSGDGNNDPAEGQCRDAGETVVVEPAQPDISTLVSDDTIQLPDGSVSDTATLTGMVAASPQGTVDFALYDNDQCSGSPVFTSVDRPVTLLAGTGTATSESFTPTDAGTYYWIASFSGDQNNEAVSGSCRDAGETVVVEPAQPKISTQVSDETIQLPDGSVSDTATLTGMAAASPQGTVDFSVYDNDQCTGVPVFTSNGRSVTLVNGTGTASSESFTPTDAGTYYWIASFSGDANNDAVSGACQDPGETVVVEPADTSVSTQVSNDSLGLPNNGVFDSAFIDGLVPATPQGTVDFAVYGPTDATCSGTPVFTSVDRTLSLVNGKWTATSEVFTPTLSGTYQWIATFSGDANNNASAGACGDAGETVTVALAVTSIETSATPQVILGDDDPTTLRDTATISGATTNPVATGTVTFNLWGPYSGTDVQDCSGTPLFTSTVPIEQGDGVWTATSQAFTPTEPGTYQWIASYSGDANNAASAGRCGDVGETSVVNEPGLTKEADREEAGPGDTIAYSVVASNTGDLPILAGVVVDTLPDFVTPVQSSISNGGTAAQNAGVWTITWAVDIPANDSVALTYAVTVDDDVPPEFDLVNRVTFFDLTAQDTVVTPPVEVVTPEEPAIPTEVRGTKLPGTGAGTVQALLTAALVLLALGAAAVAATRRRGDAA